jgi:hypothetical protein
MVRFGLIDANVVCRRLKNRNVGDERQRAECCVGRKWSASIDNEEEKERERGGSLDGLSSVQRSRNMGKPCVYPDGLPMVRVTWPLTRFDFNFRVFCLLAVDPQTALSSCWRSNWVDMKSGCLEAKLGCVGLGPGRMSSVSPRAHFSGTEICTLFSPRFWWHPGRSATQNYF